MPTRKLPDRPPASEAISAEASSTLETMFSAWRARRSPASVSSTGRRPPGRSTSLRPRLRSSAAICWLTADWV
jgi:hypothetical protein